MGNQQPKKLGKASKTQIEMGALKAKIHLELMRDRKNNEIIKAEKELVNKIKANSRNRTEEILLAERVVNGLKYAQACNQLMAYAASLRGQAAFLSENMNNPAKLEPFLTQIYSLLYAAETMGLSSLNEFKALMRALNDPTAVQQHVNPEIIQLLKPNPSPEEMNTYILEMIERNNLELEAVNSAGHKFTRDFKPIPDPSKKDDSFADLEKKLAEQFQNNMGFGNGQGGQGSGGFVPGQGYNNNMGPGGYGGQGYNPNQNPGYGGQGFNPNQAQGYNPNQGPGGFGNQGYNPNQIPGGMGGQSPNYYNLDKGVVPPKSKVSEESSNPYGIRESYNPDGKKDNFNPKQVNDSRVSIMSIDDIEYFPELDPHPKIAVDPNFDKICDILKAAM